MSNLTPSEHVALCSGGRSDELVRLNLYLRTHRIDARFVKDPQDGPTVKVPPEQLAKAKRLRSAWRKEPTRLHDDYAKVRAQRGRERAAS
jgi:hypothetical protein